MSLQDCWIIVPAFNEGPVIGEVIAGLRERFAHIVVVDDGSTDACGSLARNSGAILLRHPFNLGQGAALQTGIDFALAQGAAYLATFDADGQHQPEDLERLLDALIVEGADIALGSRFLGSAENMPLSRRHLLRFARLFTRLTTGLALSDVHNGLRAMTRDAAQRIDITHNRMSHASELLEQIALRKLNYIERPMTVTYTAYSLSKGQTAWHSVVILSELLMYGLQRKK